MERVLLKAHVKGYVKKDGTVVKGHERAGGGPQKVLFPAAHVHAPQYGVGFLGGLFGGAGSFHVPIGVPHPAPGESGEEVLIRHPSTPTPEAAWADPHAVAVFVPGGPVPAVLHGVPLAPWVDHPEDEAGWDYVDGQLDDLDEPPLRVPLGKKVSSGVVIEEPDGRVWLVSPTNAYGGYKTTYPKGEAEEELSLQANAIKEAFEETGLKVAITGFLGDFERTTSVARVYRARRVGGSPAAMGWESQDVRLVPRSALTKEAASAADAPINDLLKT